MHTEKMIATHPQSPDPQTHGRVDDVLVRCVDLCFDCAQTCIACADACLGEDEVPELRQCVRLDLDCADICTATGTVASRRTGHNDEVVRRMIETCAEACQLCAEECGKHAGHHEHCRVCAETCRQCESTCREAAIAVGAFQH